MSKQAVLNFALKTLAAIVVVATLAMVGAGIYGTLRDATYHGAQPGDVAAHLGRSGGIVFYVRPWVGTLYDWSIFLVLGGAALLIALAQVSKRLARKD